MSDATRLTVAATQWDAEMLRSALGSEGIESFTKLTDLAAGAYGMPGGGGGPVEVWVSVDDLDHARGILNRQRN